MKDTLARVRALASQGAIVLNSELLASKPKDIGVHDIARALREATRGFPRLLVFGPDIDGRALRLLVSIGDDAVLVHNVEPVVRLNKAP